jgi:hypothetical protein
MKNLILILLIMASASVQAKNRSDVKEDRLIGNVKSVSLASYKLYGTAGKPERGRTIVTSSSKYDEAGNLVEFISTALQDTIDNEVMHFEATKSIFKFDNAGNLVAKLDYLGDGRLDDSSFYKVDQKGSRIDIFTYKADGTLAANSTSEYDLRGNVVESTEYEKGKLKNWNTYKYDDRFNEIEETGHEGSGKLKWKENLTYDSKNNLVEVVDYKRDDSFAARYRYGYNSKGDLVEEYEYSSDTAHNYKKVTTKYDNEGHPIEINHFNEGGRLISQIKLDHMGLHLADIKYNDDGSLNSVIARKYDEWANEVLEDRFFVQDSIRVKYRHEYTYDQTGNWLKNTTVRNDVPIQLTERVIDYYLNPTRQNSEAVKPKQKPRPGKTK